MKKCKLFFACFILMFIVNISIIAQTNRDIIKVSYVTSALSSSMISILQEQVPSPEEYKSMVDLISKHKVYHSLYINNKTRESVFVLDSIHAEPGVMATGNIDYVYTNEIGIMTGKDDFMKSINTFSDNLSNMEWEICNESKEINGYKCQKAILKTHPEVSVWFANDIATNKGPGYFQGLIGLIFEADELFSSIYLTKVEFLDKNFDFSALAEKYKKELKGKKLSVGEILTLKQNMMKTIKKG